MIKLRRFLALLVASLACAVLATGCDDIISDPHFHTWCGDQLCSWKLESGEIRKVPTWHKKDFGVELLDGTGPTHTTAISQVVTKTPTCLEFSVIADVAEESQVSISVDFGADGVVEHTQTIATLGFREQKFQITAPHAYVGLKFTITKKGTGRAVLAQMDVRAKTDCTAAPLALQPQAIGSQCPFQKNDAGEYAWSGDVCASGICCAGVCAECCVNPNPKGGGPAPALPRSCADGATCDAVRLKQITPELSLAAETIPRQCDPGLHQHTSGEECLLADDCVSGFCDGAEWTLINTFVDGGACAPPPTQDPSCVVSYVHGGRCR